MRGTHHNGEHDGRALPRTPTGGVADSPRAPLDAIARWDTPRAACPNAQSRRDPPPHRLGPARAVEGNIRLVVSVRNGAPSCHARALGPATPRCHALTPRCHARALGPAAPRCHVLVPRCHALAAWSDCGRPRRGESTTGHTQPTIAATRRPAPRCHALAAWSDQPRQCGGRRGPSVRHLNLRPSPIYSPGPVPALPLRGFGLRFRPTAYSLRYSLQPLLHRGTRKNT